MAPPRHPPAFFGPRVVGATFVLALFGWGLGVYGLPIYLHAVVARTGWAHALVSAAITVHFLAGAGVIAALPRIHVRFGLPATTIAGAILASAGVLGWAVAAEPWQLFAAALASGAGWVTMGAAAINAIVSPWYVAGRPRALATAYNGATFGGVLFSPLWAALIDRFGFLASATAIGLATVVTVAWLSRRVFSRTPGSMGQLPDGAAPDGVAPESAGEGETAGSVGAAPAVDASAGPAGLPPAAQPGIRLWRDRAFLTLAASMALGLFAQIGLLAHLYTFLVPAFGERGAGWAMGLATACAIAGRTLVARSMAPGADRRLVAAVCYAAQLLGSLVLMAAPPGLAWPIVLGVVLFGSGIGNSNTLPPLIAQREFAAADQPRAVAQMIAVGQATYAFAPALFGLLVVSGAAAPALGQGSWRFFLFAAVVQAAAIGALLAGRGSRER